SAGPGPAGVCFDRPRYLWAARRHARSHRNRPLQRLRPAADLDHLHAVEPVPRGARGETGVPPRPRRAEGHLRRFLLGRAGALELLLILAAVVTMYIVLGVLYESYIHPLTILSTLPSAGVGALLALMLTRSDLGIIAVIGIILLLGIVKKNAIMMIDFALDAERKDGMSPRDAIY